MFVFVASIHTALKENFLALPEFHIPLHRFITVHLFAVFKQWGKKIRRYVLYLWVSLPSFLIVSQLFSTMFELLT